MKIINDNAVLAEMRQSGEINIVGGRDDTNTGSKLFLK